MGRPTGIAPVQRRSQRRMLTITSWPPFGDCGSPQSKLSRRGAHRRPTFSGLKTKNLATGPGVAPGSPRLQPGAFLCLPSSGMVLGRGNAPRSCGHRPRALLLSYSRKTGTSAWRRTKTSSLNRAVDYYYPTLVKMERPAGASPAWSDLEDRCLNVRPQTHFEKYSKDDKKRAKPPRSLHIQAAPPHPSCRPWLSEKNGSGAWSRTTLRKLMRLSRFSTSPELKEKNFRRERRAVT